MPDNTPAAPSSPTAIDTPDEFAQVIKTSRRTVEREIRKGLKGVFHVGYLTRIDRVVALDDLRNRSNPKPPRRPGRPRKDERR